MDRDLPFLDLIALTFVVIALLCIVAYVTWHGSRVDEEEERDAAIARMKAHPTTCTPEILDAFCDENLPEISGRMKDHTNL